eukprot:2035320-Pleurochrysis_carterae.AAC.1
MQLFATLIDTAGKTCSSTLRFLRTNSTVFFRKIRAKHTDCDAHDVCAALNEERCTINKTYRVH